MAGSSLLSVQVLPFSAGHGHGKKREIFCPIFITWGQQGHYQNPRKRAVVFFSLFPDGPQVVSIPIFCFQKIVLPFDNLSPKKRKE
jgi:hypothetical protein